MAAAQAHGIDDVAHLVVESSESIPIAITHSDEQGVQGAVPGAQVADGSSRTVQTVQRQRNPSVSCDRCRGLGQV